MLVATMLVIMMSIPGLALFYGGLVRSKNMLSVLMQVFSIFALITVLWTIYGYSLAFTQGNAFIGGFDRLFLKGIFDPVTGGVANAATFSKGVVIPGIRLRRLPGYLRGHHRGPDRRRLRRAHEVLRRAAVLALWFTFAYLPMAHMVWFWPGPDAFTDADAGAAAARLPVGCSRRARSTSRAAPWCTSTPVSPALVGAILVGKRIGYGREAMTPHSLTMTMIGASLLWVGWFGFNAGSALEAGGTATLAFVNTLVATAAATHGLDVRRNG
jgi:Amt family ammonium transporter